MALLVLLGAISAGAATWAIKTFRPSYQAWADVEIVQEEASIASILGAGNALESAPGVQLQSIVMPSPDEALARRSALWGLVRDGDLATAVVQRLGWAEGAFSETSLLAAIKAELVAASPISTTESNLIRITATLGSSKDAAAAANAWAEEYVRKTNLAHSRRREHSIGAMDRELQEATSSFETAQTRLESALMENRLGQWERKIAANEERIAAWHEMAGQAAMALDGKGVDAQLASLKSNRRTLNRLRQLLADAQGLRIQIEAAGEAGVASNSLAVELLKAQAYALNAASQHALELHFGNARATHANAAEQSADLDALIASLTGRIEQLKARIASQTEALAAWLRGEPSSQASLEPEGDGAPAEESIARLVAQLENATLQLFEQKERSQARLANLTQARDLALAHLADLRKIQATLQLESAFDPPEVLLASKALAPSHPLGPSPTLVGAAVGVILTPAAIFLAFFANALGIRPLLARSNAEPGGRA